MDSQREVVDVIKPGLDLYASDGERIGHIDEMAPEYLVVSDTWISGDQVYISRSHVDRQDDDRVYLGVPKDQVEQLASTQPMGAGGQTSGTWDAGRDVSTGQSDIGWSDRSTTDRDLTGGTERIPVHEEELTAQKTAREAGAVRVNKDVIEEERSIDVPVTREEVQVNRRAVDRDARVDDNAFSDRDSIRVPVVEEEVQVSKQPRVVEEIEISKQRVQGTERVADTVRREEVNVEQEGNIRPDRTTDSDLR